MPDSQNPRQNASAHNGHAEFIDCQAAEPISGAESRFRALALAALDAQQCERSRLARLLHDEIAQLLSAAGLQLDILRMDIEDSIPGVGSRTAEVQDLLDLVVKRVRGLSYDLNPDIVERAGLQPALDQLVGRFQKLFAGSLRLNYDASVRLPAATGVAFERIADAAVANAIQHARCNRIEIVVKSNPEGAELQVRDDGTGFDYESARRLPRGLGLPIMEYCASKAGLRLEVSKNAGRGMTVMAVVAGGRENSLKQDRQKPS